MLAIERRRLILEKLQSDKRVLVSQLSAAYDVSEETIRRDLEKLEREGYVTKTYGGAILVESSQLDMPYIVRKNTNVAGKQRIAELAAGLISDGDSIMLDGSSTAVFIAKKIKQKQNITVITNSIEILIELADISGWKLLSTGGAMVSGSLALVGYQAEKMISSYHVDKVFISCKGLDEARGVTDSNENIAQIKKVMLASGGKKILAVDSTKFDAISFIQIADIAGFDAVITETSPGERWEQVFASNGIELIK